jgi:hypothetical protein
MLHFVKVADRLPVSNPHFIYIVKCKDWCMAGYAVCYFVEGKFCYPEQSNDSFMGCITEWAFLGDDLDD